jgi:membrane protein DedA with SNARE-associated domain
MLDYLIGLSTRLGHWGYVVILAVAAAESAAFLGLLVPGESVVLVAGFLAAQGAFDLDALITAVALGAILGDNIGYEIGRRLRRPWLLGRGARFGLDEKRLGKADAFFSRHGGQAVFLGRFVGFARALVPFIAGSTRMRYATFLVYNALGGVVWSAGVVLLGYFIGRAAEQWVGRASAVFGAIALVAFALVLAWRWLVEHEEQVRERWFRAVEKPWVARARRRLAPQLDWLRRRLTPGGYFGLQLTVGVLVFVGAAWLFGGIAEDVVNGDPLTVFDRRIAAWFAAHETPGLLRAMSTISWLHTWPLGFLGVGFLAYLVWRRSWRPLRSAGWLGSQRHDQARGPSRSADAFGPGRRTSKLQLSEWPHRGGDLGLRTHGHLLDLPSAAVEVGGHDHPRGALRHRSRCAQPPLSGRSLCE